MHLIIFKKLFIVIFISFMFLAVTEKLFAGCNNSKFEISPGESNCGYTLSIDGTLSSDDKKIKIDMRNEYLKDIKKIIIYPKPEKCNFLLAVSCDSVACAWASIVSLSEGKLIETHAGKYGPVGNIVKFSPDCSHLLSAYSDEGYTWLYLIRTNDGKSWEIFNDKDLNGHANLGKTRWINNDSLRVSGIPCMGLTGDERGQAYNNNEMLANFNFSISSDGPKLELDEATKTAMTENSNKFIIGMDKNFKECKLERLEEWEKFTHFRWTGQSSNNFPIGEGQLQFYIKNEYVWRIDVNKKSFLGFKDGKLTYMFDPNLFTVSCGNSRLYIKVPMETEVSERFIAHKIIEYGLQQRLNLCEKKRISLKAEDRFFIEIVTDNHQRVRANYENGNMITYNNDAINLKNRNIEKEKRMEKLRQDRIAAEEKRRIENEKLMEKWRQEKIVAEEKRKKERMAAEEKWRQERIAAENAENEKKRLSKQLYVKFTEDSKIEAWPDIKEFAVNPFIYEDKIIGITGTFHSMLSRDEAIVELYNISAAIIVTDVPPGMFTQKGPVIIAGTAKGKHEKGAPVLVYKNVHKCENYSCSEMLYWKE